MIGRDRELPRLRQIAVDQLKVAASYLEENLFYSAMEMLKEAIATCEKIQTFLEES